MNSRALLAIALLAFPAVPAVAVPPVPRGGEIQVSASGFNPSIATFQDGRFVVVWNADGGARARFFDSQGRLAGGEIPLKLTGFVNQVAADRDGSFLVAWTGHTQPTSVYVRRFNPNGSPRGKLIRANAPSSRPRFNPVIAVGADGRFAVAWEAEIEPSAPYEEGFTEAVARIFSARGTPLTPEILVLEASPAGPPGDDGNFAYPASAALAPDGTLSVLVRYFGICTESRLARVAPGSSTRTELIRFDGGCGGLHSHDQALAMGKDGSLVAAFVSHELNAQRFSPRGTLRGLGVVVSEDSARYQANPSVALQAGGSFVVVWEAPDGRDGDGNGIFGRAFTAQGAPRTPDFLINVSTAGDQAAPEIAAPRKGPLLVVWSGPGGIFARVLSTSP